jgi:hypothetical protein
VNVAQAEDKARSGLPWLLIALGIVAVAIGIFGFGFGFGQQWGAAQWGPMSEWLAGAFTFGAVVVALRQAAIAQQQATIAQRDIAESQRRRLIDHELSRRRENLQALDRTWDGIAKMTVIFPTFTDYLLNLPGTFDPNVPRTDNWPPDKPGNPLAYDFSDRVTAFLDTWVQMVEPPLFLALALLKGTAMEATIRQLNDQLTELKTDGFPQLTHPLMNGRRPDVGPVDAMWNDIIRLRNAHLNLASQHFSLAIDDIEAYLNT